MTAKTISSLDVATGVFYPAASTACARKIEHRAKQNVMLITSIGHLEEFKRKLRTQTIASCEGLHAQIRKASFRKYRGALHGPQSFGNRLLS
jgi:hypothetical protein